jgi:hypothetical protein
MKEFQINWYICIALYYHPIVLMNRSSIKALKNAKSLSLLY